MNHGTEEHTASVSEPAVSEAVALTALQERVEALFVEVRRQGRAGIAAQAAAEACLKALQEQQLKALQELQPFPPPALVSQAVASDVSDVIERLLPVFDAIDGAAAEARRLAAAELRSAHRPGLLANWLRCLADGGATPNNAGRSLLTGVLLIQSELRRALKMAGVTMDDETGTPVNPERHRVVSVQKNDQESQSIVLEVLRPGYAVAGAILREADVVASEEVASGTNKERNAHDH